MTSANVGIIVVKKYIYQVSFFAGRTARAAFVSQNA